VDNKQTHEANKSMTKFDAIIIGAGQAGPSLAGRLTQSGMKVAMIERKLFGGTCVNTGCIPTKTLIASAYAAHMARRAAFYGVTLQGEVAVDMKAVKARKDEVSGASRTGVESWLRNMQNCTVYTGHARLESPTTVRVSGGPDALLEAPRIFLNVGARATTPSLPGLEQIDYLTNTSMLALDTLPQHLVIVGGSYIGIEFGQMYRRFGSKVTIVEKAPRLISHEDEDVSAAVEDILEKEGITLRTHAECITFSKDGPDSIVGVDCHKGGKPAVRGSHVLLAMGRRPNTDDLGLDQAGVVTDDRGNIAIDDQLRTSVPGIWALGDCNGHGGFTHTSYNDFEIAAANLLDNDPRCVSDRIPCYALYCDPPLGRIGLTESQVRAEMKKTGKPALIGTRPMTKVGRAVEKGESQGFMKVLVDAETKKILGASILGVGGDEAIHCILDTMSAGAPYTTLQRTVHIHPTVSELLPTVLGDLKPLV
jgi:pyruvate/2-oxoglutarate dehydrogenase complex dihydrolipoamide dehydrogenase (E3) component